MNVASASQTLVRRTGLVIALAVVVLAGTVLRVTSASATGRPIAMPSPCGAVSASPHYRHVVWIIMENVGYRVVGSPSAPYFNQLVAQCGLATNDRAVAPPSLPNYIAMTSGSTHAITDDAEPSSHLVSGPSIFSQLHGDWRALVESMPSACDHVTSGSYAARHNPAVYYVDLARTCRTNDIALTAPLDLNTAFTMIVPNICDDMHSCPVNVGDQWLRRTMARIVGSAQYRARTTCVFITFDENDGSSTNQVPTVVVAPTVRVGERVGTSFTHYSLLATTESLLGASLLGAARHAHSMVAPFHL